MYSRFPIFQSHLDLAQHYWRALVKPGDIVIDATCGNGHDTLVLAELALNNMEGRLYALDLQASAIENTKQILSSHYSKEVIDRIKFVQGCHSVFPKEILSNSINLIVYNLGYHPGGDKKKTTISELTLTSLLKSLKLLKDGGCISVTCYPGHDEGKREEKIILDWTKNLNSREWSCCYHCLTNRKDAPSLMLIQKSYTKHNQV